MDAKLALNLAVPQHLWDTARAHLLSHGLRTVQVDAGSTQRPRFVLAETVQGHKKVVSAGSDPLSAREFQVLVGMSQGKSNGQIGAELYLTEDTVKTHTRRLYRKIGANDRAHAVHLGHLYGLLGGAS